MLLLACLRGWKSMVILELSLILLYSPVICSDIVFGSPNPVFIGIVLIIVSSIIGLPVAFVVGFVFGILYAVSETFWDRCSLSCRMLAWIGLGLLASLVAPSFFILWILYTRDVGSPVMVWAILICLFMAGLAAGIDGLRLAKLGANEYTKRYIW